MFFFQQNLRDKLIDDFQLIEFILEKETSLLLLKSLGLSHFLLPDGP